MHFDPKTELTVNDQADRFLTREYRKPYVIPDPGVEAEAHLTGSAEPNRQPVGRPFWAAGLLAARKGRLR